MKSKEQTKLNILIDVLNDSYREYYTKHIGHDFLNCLDDYENSDSISYLMEHISKLNKKDKQYPSYLKHCYVIYLELQHLVRTELDEVDQNFIQLIKRSFTTQSTDRLLQFEIAIYDPAKMDEFCKEIKKDKKEFLSEVILNIVKEYKNFKEDKIRKLSHLNSYASYFSKSFDDLKN